jgi:hypothetical protein
MPQIVIKPFMGAENGRKAARRQEQVAGIVEKAPAAGELTTR